MGSGLRPVPHGWLDEPMHPMRPGQATTTTQPRAARPPAFRPRLAGWLQVFLLSTRAGGAGLNLIGGNHLVLYDPGGWVGGHLLWRWGWWGLGCCCRWQWWWWWWLAARAAGREHVCSSRAALCRRIRWVAPCVGGGQQQGQPGTGRRGGKGGEEREAQSAIAQHVGITTTCADTVWRQPGRSSHGARFHLCAGQGGRCARLPRHCSAACDWYIALCWQAPPHPATR